MLSVPLGSGTLIPSLETSISEVFKKHDIVYVELQIGSITPENLLPRIQVVSSGYSINNGEVDLTTAGRVPRWDGTSRSLVDGSLFDDGTNIGLGTASPGEKFEISGGNFRLAGNPGSGATPTTYSYQGAINSTGKQYAFAIRDSLWLTGNAFIDGNADFGTGIDVTGNITTTGLVDGYDISIFGPFFINSAGSSDQVWQSDGSGRGFWATDDNTTYSAGNDLDLNSDIFSLESTIDFVDRINFSSGDWGIQFKSSDTRIYANTSSVEDLYIEADDDLVLQPDDDLALLPGGYVGINVSAPSYPLHVESSTSRTIYGMTDLSSGTGVYGYHNFPSGFGEGVYGETKSASGRGVYGLHDITSGVGCGVRGETFSATGSGVYAVHDSPSGSGYAVQAVTYSETGVGVSGLHDVGSGTGYGVWGESYSTFGRGVYGYHNSSTGFGIGVWGESRSNSGVGLLGVHNNTSGLGWGVWGESNSAIGVGVVAVHDSPSGVGDGFAVLASTDSETGVGVVGGHTPNSGTGYGVWGETNSSTGRGVYGLHDATSGLGYGVRGETNSATGRGVFGSHYGTTDTGYGVRGETDSPTGRGIYGLHDSATGTGYGVRGGTNSTSGYGVYSVGDFGASGTKSAIIPSGKGNWMKVYSMESPEVWFEDFGSGHTIRGNAQVKIDSTFLEAVNMKEPYHVFVTSGGECPLAVVKKQQDFFTVRSLGDKACETSFDYRIVAKRLGYEKLRFEPDVNPFEGDEPTPDRDADSIRTQKITEQRLLAVKTRTTNGDKHPRKNEHDVRDKSRDIEKTIQKQSTSDLRSDDEYSQHSTIRNTGQGPLTQLFTPAEYLQQGDVVVLDHGHSAALRLCDSELDPAVVGVIAGETLVSTAEGYKNLSDLEPAAFQSLEAERQSNTQENNSTWTTIFEQYPNLSTPVAISGIIYCKVDASFGSINAGDMLVTSPAAGHAMKSPTPTRGTILGKALENLDEGTGKILIICNLQ